jgi:hypothetical protein
METLYLLWVLFLGVAGTYYLYQEKYSLAAWSFFLGIVNAILFF